VTCVPCPVVPIDPNPGKDDKQASAKSVIHCLCAFDTNDPNLKPQLEADAKAFPAWFKGLVPKERFADGDLTLKTGNEATTEAILSWCEGLKVKEEDIIFVYLGCHGALKTDKDHQVIFGKDSVSRDKILKAMSKQKVRLVVLVTDACAEKMVPEAERTVEAKPPIDWKVCVCKSLFLDATGVVDINSASPNELAWGDAQGGVMTRKFMDVAGLAIKDLDTNGDEKISWKTEFFPKLRISVNKAYGEMRARNLKDFDAANMLHEVLKKHETQHPYHFEPLPDITASSRGPDLAPGTQSATIVVATPPEATVTFDGERMTSTGPSRTFLTPQLVPGKTYYYTLEAERTVLGKQERFTERVNVRAGGSVSVSVKFGDVRTASTR
jgi:uncharacterized protein (TIGR03000 family)